ncbi:tryptophan 7-halogenase [Arenicella sp. 4NH20-0111]|uniref:tryptophan halogenase family protein n=1 Tax=Arenicella sp. 4NH20-0111 TaxID=3127648 RepID=UPI003104945D
MEHNKINKVVVAGGGTAGWMAAASLAKLLGRTIEVVLVESDDIPTVGVGEATIPTLIQLHELLGINEQEFVSKVNGTFKLGISFENWRDVNEDYIHSFGFTGKDCWAAGFQHFWLKGQKLGLAKEFGQYCGELVAAQQNKFAVTPKQGLNYAYHIDAGLYAQFLRELAEEHGAKRVEGKIVDVNLNPDTGFIESVGLESAQIVDGDFFIDCSGFRALLIEQALHTGYEDWSHWLPMDSAVAVQTESLTEPIPYTRSIARDSGWQWRIPLQSRVGNGLVFCSRYLSDEDGKKLLMDNIEGAPINEPRVLKFQTGTRRKHWNKNCVAMGLSSGFIEPLESTSIHLIQRSITRLMQMFPYDGIREPDVHEFNSQMASEIENIRDFIILHYNVTNRSDTPFWRFCKSMDIPESLKHRIELFKQTGRVFKVPTELFGENSWTQVMLGQGLMPEQYHPIVNMMDEQELTSFLAGIDQYVTHLVAQLPSHQDFINHYCKAP